MEWYNTLEQKIVRLWLIDRTNSGRSSSAVGQNNQTVKCTNAGPATLRQSVFGERSSLMAVESDEPFRGHDSSLK
jgi:hypothetical protein